jgi:DHA2 family multidrug resistance protein
VSAAKTGAETGAVKTSAAEAGGWDNSRSAAGDRNPWLIASVVSIATFMQVLDTSIANVALRQIAGSLAAGVDESTWVVTTYLVASAVIIPVSGWLSEVVGRKRYYMICVALFTIASLLCGFATNLPMLIVFRVFQGLGGGGMAPSEQAIIADTFSPAKRSAAFALYGVAVIVAPTVGPTVGGWITDNYSWHWIFFINAPIGVISLLLVQWLVVEPPVLEKERAERLSNGLKVDWLGFALVALFLGCLEIVLDKGQEDDWFQSGFIASFAAISAIAFMAFVPWELSRRDPIVDIRLLGQRQFATAFLVMMAVGAVLFGSTQLLPQLLQSIFGYTATTSGLALMPGGLAMLLLMPVAGRFGNLFQPRYMMAAGMVLISIGMWHSTTLEQGASFGYFAWMRVLQVAWLPFLFVPITTVAYSELRPESTGQASSLINVARNLGGSIGVSIANTGIAQRSQFHQSRLVESIVPSSVNYQHALERLTEIFVGQGSSQVTAQRQAIGWIGQTISGQSALLSYIDVFWGFSMFALLMVPLALTLKRVQLSRPTAGH